MHAWFAVQIQARFVCALAPCKIPAVASKKQQVKQPTSHSCTIKQSSIFQK